MKPHFISIDATYLFDPDAQKMPPETFKVWINSLFAFALYSPNPVSLANLAFYLRMSEDELSPHLAALADQFFIYQNEEGFSDQDLHAEEEGDR